MHSFTVNCDTFSNEEKVAAVVPVTSVEVSCSEAMLALSFSSINQVYFQINMYKNEQKVQFTVIHVHGNCVHLKEHLTCKTNFTN